MAVAVGRSADYDCVLANRREMVADAGCGAPADLSSCFASLEASEPASLMSCYMSAGCSEDDARSKAASAHDRCADLFPEDAELRLRRRRGVAPGSSLNLDVATKTTSGHLASATIADLLPMQSANERHHLLFVRSATSGNACMTTTSTSSKTCDVSTADDGAVATNTCSSTLVPVSKCAAGMTCSFDDSGNHICMDLENSLDIAGIIIAIAFGVFIALGIATLTFLCCRDRKEQKRLVAKAEATALARAATKKKKAARQQEQRAPLMADARRSPSVGPADPFHDGARV